MDNHNSRFSNWMILRLIAIWLTKLHNKFSWVPNFMFLGWEWSVLQDQEKHTAEETHECLLWTSVCWDEFDCLSLWWPTSPSRTDSWRGFYIEFLNKKTRFYLVFKWDVVFISAWNGGWRWDWCNVAPDWRRNGPYLPWALCFNLTLNSD